MGENPGYEFNQKGWCKARPPPDLVPGLMEDLCGFIQDDGLPAVVHAAVVHAQFETIHPFADGNTPLCDFLQSRRGGGSSLGARGSA